MGLFHGGRADVEGGCLWSPSVGPVASSWHRRNVPPGETQATLRGRTPEQSIGVPVLLCLACHNVGLDRDELNPDDPGEDGSKGDTYCDYGPMWMKTSQ